MIEDEFDEYNVPSDKELTPVSEELTLPNWATPNNSSLAAYNAIQSIYKERLEYIRTHKKKAHFSKKYTYQINKSEVARAIGKNKPNAIFHTVEYAESLTKEFIDKNEALLLAKNKSTASGNSGLNQKTKSDLVADLKKRDRYKEIAESRADEILDLTLSRLSLDTKIQLGLI
jgi:hypothetical protein